MIETQIDDLIDGIGRVVADLGSQIVALEERVRTLEARPTVKYLGVWDPGRQYDEGNMVTRSGSVWHCNEPTNSEPGASNAWVLACKRGRNGRDARNDA